VPSVSIAVYLLLGVASYIQIPETGQRRRVRVFSESLQKICVVNLLRSHQPLNSRASSLTVFSPLSRKDLRRVSHYRAPFYIVSRLSDNVQMVNCFDMPSCRELNLSTDDNGLCGGMVRTLRGNAYSPLRIVDYNSPAHGLLTKAIVHSLGGHLMQSE
jgi:hypothetical protein